MTFPSRITSYNVCYTKLLREGIGLYNFENDDFQSSFDLGALIGFSFFLH